MSNADYLNLGDWNATCFECGRKKKASTLLKHWQGYYVCPEHFETRHPQDFVRAVHEKQTPPWTQPQPADSFAFGDSLITDSSDTDENFDFILTETFYPIAEEG